MGGTVRVDAATPLPFSSSLDVKNSALEHWESREGFVSSNRGWEVWTGSVEYHLVDWKTPSRSSVRSLMDGGDGPPFLAVGCTVMRGTDWSDAHKGATESDEDGKDKYDIEKATRDKEKRQSQKGSKDDESTEQVESQGEKAPTDESPSDPADEPSGDNPAGGG